MKNIHFAIIGYGSIAKTHANAAFNANLYKDFNFDLNLKSVYSRSEKRVPLGTLYTNHLEDILTDKELAFIDICSPNDAHLTYIKEAIKAKKAIYCEKPITESVLNTQEAVNLVNQTNTKNAVALVYRFTPAIQLLKILLAQGEIGPIIGFDTTMYHKSYLDPTRKGKWRTLSESGGGALLDLGVHSIDMIHYLFGQTKSVDAKTAIHFIDRTSVDEISELSMVQKNGIKGRLTVSRIYAQQFQSTTLIVYGEHGSYAFDSSKPQIIEHYDFKKDQTVLINAKNYPETMHYYTNTGSFVDLHMATLLAFADELSSGINNDDIARFEDALQAQRVVEAAYLSSEKDTIIDID